MRRLRLLAAVCALAGLALVGETGAQTVTPVASQLLPCRAGAGDFNTCGGLCAVGYHCVYVPSSAACSCQVDGLVCGVGTQDAQGYCPGLPGSIDGDCERKGANAAGTNYRCR